MLRIFQTGDNHIGLKYAGHENADVIKQARIDAFENMVSVANKEECDLFVITGDLFDNTYGISKGDVKKVLDMLACFRGIVVVLPGNHDYYDEGAKAWQYFRDVQSDKDNIMLLTEYRPYSLSVNDKDVVLYPAHCTSKHSGAWKNNLGWIKKEEITPDDTYKIGIAHGSVQGETIDEKGVYFPMTRDELEKIPVDVWFIGHTHVPFPSWLREEFSECEKILNAGTHVQTDVACNTEGICFIVEIDDNKKIRAKKVKSGNFHFYRKNIVLEAGKMEAILKRETADIPDKSSVELILSGAVTIEEYDNGRTMIKSYLSRFVEGTYNYNSLRKLISKELLDSEFAETSFSGKLLTALLDDPKEAQMAYEMLKLLNGEDK